MRRGLVHAAGNVLIHFDRQDQVAQEGLAGVGSAPADPCRITGESRRGGLHDAGTCSKLLTLTRAGHSRFGGVVDQLTKVKSGPITLSKSLKIHCGNSGFSG